jgi:hypothetical protein
MSRSRPRPLLERTVEELLRLPSASEAFRRVGLADCIGCAMAKFETVAEVLRTYRLEAERVLPELRRALEEE